MSLQTLINLIVAAIAAVAILIPGLNALEESITQLREAKYNEVKQLCPVLIARDKVTPENLSTAEDECERPRVREITNNFKPALDMIASFRTAVLAGSSASATQ